MPRRRRIDPVGPREDLKAGDEGRNGLPVALKVAGALESMLLCLGAWFAGTQCEVLWNVLACLAGAVLGSSLGILVSPVTPREKKEFGTALNLIAVVVSGTSLMKWLGSAPFTGLFAKQEFWVSLVLFGTSIVLAGQAVWWSRRYGRRAGPDRRLIVGDRVPFRSRFRRSTRARRLEGRRPRGPRARGRAEGRPGRRFDA